MIRRDAAGTAQTFGDTLPGLRFAITFFKFYLTNPKRGFGESAAVIVFLFQPPRRSGDLLFCFFRFFFGLFCARFGSLFWTAYRGNIADFLKIIFGIQSFLCYGLTSSAKKPPFNGITRQFKFPSHF